MKMKVFAVGAADASGEDELNEFLGRVRVVGVDRALVVQAGWAYWAVAVTYAEGGSGGAGRWQRGPTTPKRGQRLAPDPIGIVPRQRPCHGAPQQGPGAQLGGGEHRANARRRLGVSR